MHTTQDHPNIYGNFGGIQERYRQQHTLGDFDTPLSKMHRSFKQNINKKIAALNNALDEIDFIDTQRNFHAKEAKYTFLTNAHETFSKVDHMIGHKNKPQQIQEN